MEAMAQVRMLHVVWLRSGAVVDWRNRCRYGEGIVVIDVVAVLERFQRDQLGELSTEDLWMTTKVVYHHCRCLLVLGEITTLKEHSGTG